MTSEPSQESGTYPAETTLPDSDEFPEPPQEGDGQDDGGDAPPPDDPDAVDDDPEGTL